MKRIMKIILSYYDAFIDLTLKYGTSIPLLRIHLNTPEIKMYFQKKGHLVLMIFFLMSSLIYCQSNVKIDSLYKNSYQVFEQMRLPNGMYRDSKLISGIDYHPISVSNTGMGLIALCIADSMGWISNAKDQVLNTLQSVNGYTPGFIPDRTSNGYFRHFLDVSNGSQAWNSEYSTIDTDILMCGALFANKYFNNPEISDQVTLLANSIDFNAAIADASTGKIFLTLEQDGSGNLNTVTLPYNEYMIVAWLAKNMDNQTNGPADILWNNFFHSTVSLPKISYNNFEVLTDNSNAFLSSFTHQFNYYLCHHFTVTPAYLDYFQNSLLADKAWWYNLYNDSTEFGLGAGSAVSISYHADAINNNPDYIVSPHIISGYLPIDTTCKSNLIQLWDQHLGKYQIPGFTDQSILWRYSKSNPQWIPNEICGVDYSLMLFGLATLPEYLGIGFFETYNDFFSNSIGFEENYDQSIKTIIYPNPCEDHFMIELNDVKQPLSVEIFNTRGTLVWEGKFENQSIVKIQNDLEKGIYFVRLLFNERSIHFKIEYE